MKRAPPEEEDRKPPPLACVVVATTRTTSTATPPTVLTNLQLRSSPSRPRSYIQTTLPANYLRVLESADSSSKQEDPAPSDSVDTHSFSHQHSKVAATINQRTKDNYQQIKNPVKPFNLKDFVKKISAAAAGSSSGAHLKPGDPHDKKKRKKPPPPAVSSSSETNFLIPSSVLLAKRTKKLHHHLQHSSST